MKQSVWTIEPDYAVRLLERNTGNRPIRRRTVTKYAREMAEGQWQLTGETVIFSREGRLLNGQHRLLACIEADTPFTTCVVEGIDEAAFTSIDQGTKRSATDLLVEHLGLSQAEARLTSEALQLYDRCRRKFVRGSQLQVNKDIITLANENPEALASARFARDEVNKSKGFYRAMNTGYVAGFHYLFSRVDRFDADTFIHRMVTGESLAVGDPIWLLRERLMADIPKSTGKMTFLHKAALTVKAWNAFRRGETPSKLRFKYKAGTTRTGKVLGAEQFPIAV